MPIKFRCEHCQQLLGISQTKSGENVDCPTCGRSVQVPTLDGSTSPSPTPKWDAKDLSLLNALESLASLNEPHPEPPTLSDSDKNQLADSPKPVVIPESLELPPLSEPVILSEPSKPSVVDAVPDKIANEPATPAPQKDEDPFAKLAALSSSRQAESSAETQTKSAAFKGSGDSPKLLKQGVNTPIVAIIAIIAFGLGFMLGGRRETDERSHSDNVVATKAPEDLQPPAKNEQADQTAATTDMQVAIEGRISYRTVDGNTRPDEGAVVIFLPAYRKSSALLPIVGFRPADSTEDRDIARAAIRALGGDLVKVGEDGLYASTLQQAGEYHVIVLSRHVTRPEATPVQPSHRSTLGAYFERPQQLMGQLAYQVGTVTYRGEKTEIWDHAFEAS